MTKRLYQILILGAPTPAQVDTLRQTLQKSIAAFGLRIDHEVVIATRIDLDFDETLTSVAVFFGAPGTSLPEYPELARHGIPVVPLVSDLRSVSKELPDCLRPINAMGLVAEDVELVRPAAAALQCLGLLPSQRRVFISYRRDDSREVAVQLFETLSAKQFEVFLDTHSVGVAADFQSVLWHRMCDSDVVVMLDTPGYFDGRWTRQEFGRANDKQITMLQVVWPGHSPSRFSRLAVPLMLEATDFQKERLSSGTIEHIALQIEVLRSKGTALRHANLAGCLRSAVEDLGGTVIGVGPRRSIAVKLGSGASVVAYPTIGVPTAISVHEATNRGNPPDPRPAVLVYDHVGISEQWMSHLGWLGQAVPSVRWIKSREAAWGLSALEEA